MVEGGDFRQTRVKKAGERRGTGSCIDILVFFHAKLAHTIKHSVIVL